MGLFIGALVVYLIAVPFGMLNARHMEDERVRESYAKGDEYFRRW